MSSRTSKRKSTAAAVEDVNVRDTKDVVPKRKREESSEGRKTRKRPMEEGESSHDKNDTKPNGPQATSGHGQMKIGEEDRYPPIAIVGMGCRFPGDVNTVDDFVKVFEDGRYVVSDVPADRWSFDKYYNEDPTNTGTHANQKMGFLKNVHDFDHTFFNISPREAGNMDVQQRHLLEVFQDTLDDAGIPSETLPKDRTGVYIGIGLMDHGFTVIEDAKCMNAYTHTGTAHSVAANRINYHYDLRGPSVAIDTACAASLTAMHYACNGLWNKECDIGIVGGCNTIMVPEVTVGFSALGVLAPDSMSCPFSDQAKGYVRSEGVGVVLLKTLDDAIRDGDHVYCTIRASSVAHNGFSLSITMPSTDAQAECMKNTYEHFGIPRGVIDYIEAHGTGTPVGDPIEAEAIAKAFCDDPSRKKPLPVGSSKSHFGHLECAAGMAQILKAACMLQRREIFPNIHFGNPNPKIDCEGWNIMVPEEFIPYKEKKNMMVGINTFGFGGSLAHMIFEEFIPPQGYNKTKKGVAGWKFGPSDKKGLKLPISLSAKSSNALRALAQSWIDYESVDDAQEVACWTASKRSHYSSRILVSADSGADFRNKLQLFVDKQPCEEIVEGNLPHNLQKQKIVFLFPGQGQQSFDMGRTLYKDEPVFRKAVDDCDAIYKKLSGKSFINTFKLFVPLPPNDKSDPEIVNEINVSQPAILFLQIGLFHLLEHYGVKPDVVVGHSLGEVASGYSSGAMTLEEAVTVQYFRAQQQVKLAGSGSMAAMRVSEEEGDKFCSKYNDLYVACINGPESITIAGGPSVIKKICDENPGQTKQIRVKCAFHTPHMDPLKNEFLKSMKGKLHNGKPTTYPMYSTVTGELYTDAVDAEYCWDNIRERVNFTGAINAIFRDHGEVTFIELAGSQTLLSSIRQIARAADVTPSGLINCGQRGKDDRISMLRALGNIYGMGIPIDWANVHGNCAHWLKAPTYAWQHQTFRYEAEGMRRRRLDLEDRTYKGLHGTVVLDQLAYLKDHMVEHELVFPRSGFVEYMLQSHFPEEKNPAIKDVSFEKKTLPLPEDIDLNGETPDRRTLMLVKNEESLEVHCDNGEKYAAGVIVKDSPVQSHRVMDVEKIKQRCGAALDGEEFYAKFEALGLTYEAAFKPVTEAYIGDGEALAVMKPPRDQRQRIQTVHLDSAFLTAMAARHPMGNTLLSPSKIASLQMSVPFIPVKQQVTVYARLTDVDSTKLVSEIFFLDPNGLVLAHIDGFEALNEKNLSSNVDLKQCVYDTYWETLKSELPSTTLWKKIGTAAYLSKHHAKEFAAVTQAEKYLDTVKQICSAYARNAVTTVPKKSWSSRIEKYINRLQNMADSVPAKIKYEDIPRLSEEIKKGCPEFALEVDMVSRLGEVLHETVVDPAVALKILFMPENMHEYFIDSITTRIYYKMIADGVAATVKEARKHKKIVRVLEVGGRMGGLAKYICEAIEPFLKDGTVEYIFTDINVAFFQEVKEKTLGVFPNIRYQQFDIEKDIKQQAFAPGIADVVVCMDTLHCTENGVNSTKNMRDVLAEDGHLIVMESTNNHNTPEIIFGAFDLCWIYQDERGDRCWLGQQGWSKVMRDAGFSDVLAVSTPKEFFHSLIIGRKTETSIYYKELEKQPAEGEESMEVSSASDMEPLWMLVHLNDTTVAKELKKRLGKKTEVMSADKFKNVQESLIDREGPVNIVFFWNEKDANLSELLSTVQGVQGLGEKTDSALWVVTVEANSDSKLDSSTATGFLRVICNEVDNIQVYHVDIENSSAAGMSDDVYKALQNYSETSHEMAVRNGKLVVPKVLRKELNTKKTPTEPEWRFESLDKEESSLDKLDFHEVLSLNPGRSQVKVRVMATSINSTEIDNIKNGQSLKNIGMECSGIVQSVGRDVRGINVGQEVIAFSNSSLASHVIVDADSIVKKPSTFTFAQAAGTGLAFAAADYALLKRSHAEGGETVLIHSACSAEGQAAIQLAQQNGIYIMATEDTKGKKTFLKRQCGIQSVADSNNFSSDVMKWTKGQGVDVVLSLGESASLDKSLECLATGGRLCVVDFNSQNSSIASKALKKNVSFITVNFRSFMEQYPQKVKESLSASLKLLENEDMQPVFIKSAPIQDLAETIENVEIEDIIGKMVFEVPQKLQLKEIEPSLQLFKPNATYVITGGHGSVAMEMARWMTERGARHLALISRTGPTTWSQENNISFLKEQGVVVLDVRADLSKEKDTTRAFQTLTKNGNPPIKGIFHLAGINQDSGVAALSIDDLQNIVASKGQSALNVHNVTTEMGFDLDHFVMFSSAANIWGHPNTSALCAANNFLDVLAKQRQANNLPALSLQIGWLRGAGWIEAKGQGAQLLEKVKPTTMHVKELFDAMHKILPKTDLPPVVCLTNEDWDSASDFTAKDCSRFWSYTSAGPRRRAGGDLSKDDLERKVVEKLANLLMMAADDIDSGLPMIHYGVDSLVSLDIVNWMRKEFNLQVNQMDILEGMTTATLTEQALA